MATVSVLKTEHEGCKKTKIEPLARIVVTKGALMRFKRQSTTVHPSVSYRTNTGLSATGPSLNLCSGEDDLGFKFFSRKDARECLRALTGYSIYLDIRKAAKTVCYYNSRRTGRAKKDVYTKTSVQIWLEHRDPESSTAESTTSLYEVPSPAISANAQAQRPFLSPNSKPVYSSSPPALGKFNAFRTFSRGSAGATSITSSVATSNSFSSTSSGQSNSHTVRLEPAVVAESPESAKLIIFAEPEGKEATEIIVMEIDPYIAILPDQCCNRRKPQRPEDPFCCMRVWLERINSSSKHIRLNYFEQQEESDGGKLGNGSQIRILGPGLPVNVDEWPKKASRQQKVESLAIEFEGEADKRNFLTAYDNMIIFTNAGLAKNNNWDHRR
ncbi:hypothetical protein DFH27DRAFT_13521 [Peziza echinospora]|nr:hypothetical protein DFH27DRAFT_13521 [Peziza echinospora]